MRFDLFGHPIPANAGERGRPEHAPDPEIARKIRLLLISGWTLGRIAHEVGLSVPTIRKHYFASGKIRVQQAREMARAEQLGKCILALDAQVEAGNVAAIRQMREIIQEAERQHLREQVTANRPETPRPAGRPLPKGKKEEMVAAAQAALAANPDITPGLH